MEFPETAPQGLMTPTAANRRQECVFSTRRHGGFFVPALKGASMTFKTCLLIMAGGALGTLARYLISLAALPISGQLPVGTLIVNMTGSFVIGAFGTLTLAAGRYPVPEDIRLFVMIGVCGGYTTFSSFSLQTLDLLRSGALGRAALNVVASVLLCIAAVALGHALGACLNGGAGTIAQLPIEEEA